MNEKMKNPNSSDSHEKTLQNSIGSCDYHPSNTRYSENGKGRCKNNESDADAQNNKKNFSSENTAANYPNNSENISIINAFNRNKRMNIMVIGAACGLVFCLLMLTTYKNDLPGEIVGIVSTIAGIFGACLKDAYSFEFGSSRKKDSAPESSGKRGETR